MTETKENKMSTQTIRYYAVALNPDGEIGQLSIVRKLGKHSSATWTGKTYPNMKEARADLIRLNCG